VRWFVTGSAGQLGTALVGALGARGHDFGEGDRALDVTNAEALRAFLEGLAAGPPEVLVNAAALTQVDRCEREPELAQRVNALAPASLAKLCAEWKTRLVHVSTDYVFGGEGERPYREEDPVHPRSVYGATKLAGEEAVRAASPRNLVVRSSWVFGRGRNFVAAVLSRARSAAEGGEGLRVVDDQRGRPTYASDLAEGLVTLVEGGARGLYHLANSGEASWWDVARLSLDQAGYAGLPIQRIGSEELHLAAPRPRYSVLDCSRAEGQGVRLRSWQDALEAFLSSADAPDGGPEQRRRASS